MHVSGFFPSRIHQIYQQQSEEPTYATISEQDTNTLQSSMQHAPNADATYQPLSKEFMSPKSTYEKVKQVVPL